MDIIFEFLSKKPKENISLRKKPTSQRVIVFSLEKYERLYKKNKKNPIVGAGLKHCSFYVLLYREGKQLCVSDFKLKPRMQYSLLGVYTLGVIASDMREWHKSIVIELDHISGYIPPIILQIIESLPKKENRNGGGYLFKDYQTGKKTLNDPYLSFVSLLRANGFVGKIEKGQRIAMVTYIKLPKKK